MDESRFDAWTRRRFGLVVGGGAASLLGLSARDESAAKKKRKGRCRRVQQACQPGNRRKRCCNTLRCEENLELGSHHCCRPLRGLCEEQSDCCGSVDLDCNQIAGLGAETRCCGLVDHACTDGNDCCGNLSCRLETGRCEGK